MAATYEPIATTTLGSNTYSITFSSIPATYTDLKLVMVGNGSNGGNICIRFNGDTGNNYSGTFFNANGNSNIGSNRYSNSSYLFVGNSTTASTTTTPRLDVIDIPFYAGSTFKSVLMSISNNHANSTASNNHVEVGIGLWSSTSAINEIQFLWNDLSFRYTTGTIATLYGILKA